MEGEASEQDHEHWGPFEVFEEGGEEGFFAEAVAEDCETDWAHEVEDDDDGDENCWIGLIQFFKGNLRALKTYCSMIACRIYRSGH